MHILGLVLEVVFGALLVIFALVCIGIGAYLVFISLSDTICGIKSKRWTIVESIITANKVDTKHSRDSDGPTTTYALRIAYSYEFGGTKYTSDRVSFGRFYSMSSDKREALEKKEAKYPFGTSVKVYCNPKNPQQSTLNPGFKADTLWGYFGGLCLLCSGAASIFFALPEMWK